MVVLHLFLLVLCHFVPLWLFFCVLLVILHVFVFILYHSAVVLCHFGCPSGHFASLCNRVTFTGAAVGKKKKEKKNCG